MTAHLNIFRAGATGEMGIEAAAGWWIAVEKSNGRAGEPVAGPFDTQADAIDECIRLNGTDQITIPGLRRGR